MTKEYAWTNGNLSFETFLLYSIYLVTKYTMTTAFHEMHSANLYSTFLTNNLSQNLFNKSYFHGVPKWPLSYFYAISTGD